MRRLIEMSRKAYYDLDQEIAILRDTGEYDNYSDEDLENKAWQRIFYLASQELNCYENQLNWTEVDTTN